MAEKAVDVSCINKFDGQNYHQWKFQIKCALKAKGVYDVADGTTPKPRDPGETLTAWNKKDALAMFTLTAAMNYSQITLIENCDSAKEILDKLDSVYMQKTEMNKMVVHERFHQYKMDINDSVAQHVAKVENLAKQVKDAGEQISHAAVMTKILSTLPSKFRNVRQAWLSLDESKQTIANLTARLLDEETSLASLEEAETALSTVSFKGKKKPVKKFNGKCYKCHNRGHFAKHCKTKAAPSTSKEQNGGPSTGTTASAFNIESENNVSATDCWIMDSGASAHMCYRREYFSTFELVDNANVILGNNHTLSVKGKGMVRVRKFLNERWYDATINNVLYVPELKKNLFSEGVLTSKGMKIIKEDTKAEIFDKSGLIAIAVRDSSNIYKMMFHTEVVELNVTARESLKLWHERLGHVNIKSLQEMVTKGLVEGVDLSDANNFFCEACAYGKQHQIPFHKTVHQKMQVGEKIYSDVCGPMNTPSVKGSKYFVTFKDDFSGFRCVYFVKHKSDVLNYFKEFARSVKNKFNRQIKVLHTDNGTEYCNHEFKSFLLKEGIQHETTAPYTPQQNGRAERDNRTIIESAKSMIYGAGVARFLWAEAVNTAVYILNRTGTCQAPNSTPFELWHGKKPNMAHVRTFGVEAYVFVPEQKRTKLDPKSKKYILVGYDNESNNYRLFEPSTKKVVISRNVLFNENVKGFVPKPEIFPVSVSDDTMSDEEIHEQRENVPEEQEVENENNQDRNMNIPELRPQRNIQIPRRYEDYILNFAETDVPQSYEAALNSKNSKDWSNAITEELDALHKNETWQLCKLPDKANVIDSKWVFKIKQLQSPDGKHSRFKARLCARGYKQQKGIDYNEVFAPTTRYDSIRVLLAVAAQNHFEMMQFDIKTAFLYGELNEELYMSPPEGLNCEKGLVCKLKKSLYGLKQSPRCWNNKFNSFLTNFGFVQSNADKCIYKGELDGIKVLLILYVDDGIIMSTNMCVINKVLFELQKNFEITISKVKYFVGLEITQNKNDGSIFISQENYIKNVVNRFGLEDANPVSTPGDPHVNLSVDNGPVLKEGEVPYRQCVGSLMFAAIVSRVDIAHSVGVVSRYLNNPTNARWNAVKRILKYLLGTANHGITYKRQVHLDLIGFSDSDYASDCKTRHSTTGYVFKICGGPITWTSKKQTSVCLSTTEAEYVAASQATKEVIWLQELLNDIGEKVNKPTILHIDNQSAIRLIRNPEYHNRTKHIDIRYHFVREKYEEGIITPTYISTTDQEADILTKALPKGNFERIHDLLGLGKQ